MNKPPIANRDFIHSNHRAAHATCNPDRYIARVAFGLAAWRAFTRRGASGRFIGALFVAALATSAGAATVELPADIQQGQLVIARIAPGNEVELDGRRLRMDTEGRFVFGVGRDAPAQITLEVSHPDGSTETVPVAITQREYRIERVNGLPQHTVTPNPKIAARIAREQAAVGEARKRDSDTEYFLHGFRRPVSGARISGVYGSQRIDNGSPKSPHMGLDMAVPTGTPVHAPASGVVSFARTDLVLTGGTVLIDHGFGLNSSFLHMSRVDVKVGDQVQRGEVIGAAGMTGRASGPHVHWGFNWFDVRLDPALLPKPHD